MHKMVKCHHFNRLSMKEKACIGTMIGISFMRGICVGLYLSRK